MKWTLEQDAEGYYVAWRAVGTATATGIRLRPKNLFLPHHTHNKDQAEFQEALRIIEHAPKVLEKAKAVVEGELNFKDNTVLDSPLGDAIRDLGAAIAQSEGREP